MNADANAAVNAVMATLVHLSLLSQGNSTAFPPGWNHLAKSPPMGWRSWNAFGANINDKTFATRSTP